MKDSKGHIIELQSVRGLAALVVLIGHAISYYTMPDWFDWVNRFFNANAAVVIFFVLSGYVLTLSLASRKIDLSAAKLFYIRRIFRIYPAIWSASLLALAYVFLMHWKIHVPGTSPWFQDRFKSGRSGLLFIAASFAGTLAFLLPPLWTIFVELVASVFMPVFAWAAQRRGVIFASLFFVTLAASIVLGAWSYYGVAEYMIDFVCGAGIAILPATLLTRWKSQGTATKNGIALIATLALFFCRFLHKGKPEDPLVHFMELAPAWVVVASIVHADVRPAFLRLPSIVRLGDISYSLYLVHFTVMCIVAKLMFLTIGNIDHVELATLLVLFTAIPTVILSDLQYRFVELPGIELGRRFTNRMKRPKIVEPRESGADEISQARPMPNENVPLKEGAG